jgi:hypothetical protein
MKKGNLSNKTAKYVYIDAESLFNFKVMTVLKPGVNDKIRLLLQEFNVCLFLDKRKNLAEELKKVGAIFLVSMDRISEFRDIENVYPLELSINAIKELI